MKKKKKIETWKKDGKDESMDEERRELPRAGKGSRAVDWTDSGDHNR